MAERTLDREMVDCYLTMIEAVDPEAAAIIEAAYENTDNDEEVAEMIMEACAEHGIANEFGEV